MSQDVHQICTEKIRELLTDHVQSPLKNMREEDFRATLLAMLRSGFEEMVPAMIETVPGSRAQRLLKSNKSIEGKTSRVHAEVKLGNGKERFDLVILRNRLAHFQVKRGLTDVLASIPLEDVEAVIEVKAAPLNHPSIEEGIRSDLNKLSKLRNHDLELLRVLVVIDKSLSLGLAENAEDSDQVKTIEDLLAKEVRLRHENNVEVWYLNGRTLPPQLFTLQQTQQAAA